VLNGIGALAFARDLTTSERNSHLDRLETISDLNWRMVGESGQLLHAPFAPGADSFHLTPSDAFCAATGCSMDPA